MKPPCPTRWREAGAVTSASAALWPLAIRQPRFPYQPRRPLPRRHGLGVRRTAPADLQQRTDQPQPGES
ncbi:hypothetical protein [Streptomyces erythrochromogenes]|uniref:hypothetical protein n=1 Tax=Streptomyces erythrochromogenes TaxID=285574 RepID=UPI0036867E92